jgi:hypothetical protein
MIIAPSIAAIDASYRGSTRHILSVGKLVWKQGLPGRRAFRDTFVAILLKSTESSANNVAGKSAIPSQEKFL